MTVRTAVDTSPAATSFVGSALRRNEDRRLVTGAARFIADVSLPRSLQVAFVRSSNAHARLVRTNVERALRAPGVVAVFTSDDLRDVRPIRTPFAGTTYRESDYPVLAVGKVRFAGEPIAAVVAESRYLAEDAAELVDVTYEPLRAVVTIEDALDPEAPLIHDELPGNIFVDEQREIGEVDPAFAQSVSIVEATFRTQRSQGAPIECRGALADYDAGTGRLTLWNSTNIPHIVRYGLAECLGVPENLVRVVGPDVGGSFGTKTSLDAEVVVLSALSRTLGRPVRWIEDRREDILCSPHAHEQRLWLRLGADAAGRFTALESDIVLNGGAYSLFPDTPCNEIRGGASSIVGPYRIEHYRYRARAVVTTTGANGPIRGVGRAPVNFAFERLVDMLARRLGMDPLELRQRNLVRPADMPYRTITGLDRDSGDYPAALQIAAERLGYRDFKNRQKEMRREGRLVGVGVSCFAMEASSGTVKRLPRKEWSIAGYDGALVRVDSHGRTTLFSSAASGGQGIETTLAQLAADELGTDPADIVVRHNDTDLTPYGMGSTGSRTTISSGGAVVLAARKVREKMLGLGAHLLREPMEALEVGLGRIYVRAEPSRAITIAELARVAYRREGSVPAGFEPGLEAVAYYDPPGYGVSSNSVHAAAVEVDTETGAVSLLRYVVVADSGRIVNPAIVDGQLRGGAVQGIGKALLEDVTYDRDGQLVNASFMDFLLPTMSDVPAIEVVNVESPSPLTVRGLKGVGESGIIGAPAAIGNAIADALGGLAELSELPFTPQRVLEAVERVKSAEPVRS